MLRWIECGVVACVGVAIGSYVSAELLHFHFQDQPRTASQLLEHSLEGFCSSPLAMTFGLLPTIGFYSPHGLLVIPGALLTLAGVYMYCLRQRRAGMIAVFLGCVLWSHNNYLGFSALMSV